MNPLIQLKTTIPPLLITLALLCFGLLPQAQAVVPPPDGAIPGSTQRKGKAPFSPHQRHWEYGSWLGFALCNITGSFNTGCRRGALLQHCGDQIPPLARGAFTQH